MDKDPSAMRLAVSGNGYTSATSSFLDANRLAATTAQTLMAALEDSRAMAGHTAASFATSYDKAAREGVYALVDLVYAVANLSLMTDATWRNHADAELRAIVNRTAPLHDTPPAPVYSRLTARQPPSAAGTHGPELPTWAAWILDRIEGFVWPDSDIDRLRATARAWRIASSQLEIVKSHCLDAALSLSIEIAPDVELASDATRKLATHVDSLAQTFHGLARSCDDLADQVHHHREQVLDIVRDTVRDAVIVEGIGLVLGAVTGGITAAAATSINGTRIATIAPHIIRIIEALRIAIGASETGARIATESVLQARTSLRAFIDARIITMGSERGCALIPTSRSLERALAKRAEQREFRMLGTSSATRAIRFRHSDVDSRWGLTGQHVRKHLFGDGPHSLKTIDPGGNAETWKGYLQDLATRPPTSLTDNGKINIVGQFPRSDGSGTFTLGIRLHQSRDGSYELITLLTRQ